MKKRLIALLAAVLLGLFGLTGCDVLQQVLQDEGVQSALTDVLTDAISDANVQETAGDALSLAPTTTTTTPDAVEAAKETPLPTQADAIDEAGTYTTRDDVALYLFTFGHLPDNFITKAQAQKLGWSGGGLDRYADGTCIGGDRFGNYEGLLPKASGRTYTECDIDTLHKNSRGAKRIVFSNDGLIYYTDDHYASFTLLYGEDAE